jgi:hypothetical protein
VSEIPSNILRELDSAGVDAEKKELSANRFHALSDPAKTAVMAAGFRLYDEVTEKQFNAATSMDRADFLRRGGRVVKGDL